jgi:pyruvate/2-oxoglutarate dehydrogenase complex dihydrolipoamide dehydrogenase (E3) component
MAAPEFDLVIIGAGSGGLTAAGFAAQLGAKVALVENNRIGGDCTWTGCIPSKALLKAAKVAHEVRTASRFGITASPPVADMSQVRAYVRQAIEQVYRFENPEELRKQGIEVIQGAGRFLDATTLLAGEQLISSKNFLLTTGASPRIPSIAGHNEVPFLTYEQIFDNDRLPRAMVVVGGGPIGMEMAQAYQRLGARVSVVADRLLPKDEPEVREVLQRVFEREEVRFVWGRAQSARKEGGEIVVATADEEVRGDLLLIACGRKPTVAGLDLEKAGVTYSDEGIPVDDRLRTNVKNIYAAGDVTGGYQFTHFAGWQAFQAVRNALLPGNNSGLTDLVPWVTFTDPEVAHVGLTEEQARDKFGENLRVCRCDLSRTDRAICEDDHDGFTKVIAKKNGIL